MSATSGDYPIGPGGTEGLFPSGAGTSNVGSNIKDDAGVKVSDTTNPANVELDDDPLGSGTDYIKQSGTASTNYAAVAFADTTKTTILGVRAFEAYKSATATANSASAKIYDEDGIETAIYTGDMSETTTFYKSVICRTPTGGWDAAAVNALQGRVGYATDFDPNPYWMGLMVQVAYYEEDPPTPVLIADSGAGAESLSIRAKASLAEAGAGVDLVSLLAKIACTDVGAGSDAEPAIKGQVFQVDAGAGADGAPELKVLVEQSDAGAGADSTPVLKISVSQSDVGVGADGAPTVKALVSQDEAGAGSDAEPVIAVPVAVSDAGSGADGIEAKAGSFGIGDSGTGLDEIIKSVSVHLFELCAGADAVWHQEEDFVILVFGASAVLPVRQETVLDVFGDRETVMVFPVRLETVLDVYGERETNMEYIVVNPDEPIEKAVGSKFRIGLDIKPPLLASGETIASANCAASPAGLTLTGAVVISGSVIKQMVEAGTSNQLYQLLFDFTTSAGHKQYRAVLVRVL